MHVRFARRPVAALAMVASLAAVAVAHSPHDVINVTGLATDAQGQLAILASGQLTGHKLLMRSVDDGLHWDLRDLPVQERDVSRIRHSPSYASDGRIFVGTTDTGLLRSADRGQSWQLLAGVPLTIDDVAVSPLVSSDGLVLCSGPGGVLRSDDFGDTWSATPGTGLLDNRLSALGIARAGARQLVTFGAGRSVHSSSDGGLTWTALHTFDERVATLEVSPRFVVDQTLAVVLQNGGGVWTSTDGGGSWQSMGDGLAEPGVNDIALAADGSVYAVTREHGLHRAAAVGLPFAVAGSGFEALSDLTANHFRSVDVTLGDDGVVRVVVGSFEGLYVSDDGGDTFRQADIYTQRFNRRVVFDPAYAQNGQLYLVNYGGGLYRSPPLLGAGGAQLGPGAAPGVGFGPGSGPSSSSGAEQAAGDAPVVKSWAALSHGVSAVFGQELVLSPGFAHDRTLFYAQVGVWRSEDAGATWIKQPLPPDVPVVRSLALTPGFERDRTVFLGSGLTGVVYRSTDAGESWQPLTAGLPLDPEVSVLRVSPDHAVDDTVFLASKAHGVWRSVDGGETWSDCSAGLGDLDCRDLAISPDFAVDGTLLAATSGAGMFRSSDRGDSWTPINVGLLAGGPTMESVALSPDFGRDGVAFVASLTDGVFRSDDRGDSWQPVGPGLPASPPRLVSVSPAFGSDATLMVSGYDWVWRSTDGGASFSALPGYARVDDVNTGLAYAGEWFTDIVPAHGASAVASYDAGASCELGFDGEHLRWFSMRGPDMGIARVLVDGALVADVDLYAPVELPVQPVFTSELGAEGWHVVCVVNRGLSNPASTGTRVVSDGFDYQF